MRPGYRRLGALAIVAAVGAFPARPQAQDPASARVRRARTVPQARGLARDLARVCAGEASVQTRTPDCAAIYQTAVHGARGRDFGPRAWLRDHSDGHFERRGDRPWIARLRPGLHPPQGWPRGALPWGQWRPRVRALFAHARALVRGRVAFPCPEAPDTWGNDADLEQLRARRPDTQVLDCGGTLNHFVHVP